MRKIYISILLMILACASANATTWTVTSLADSGAGTLRAAITSANADSGDTINFGSLSGTITLASALPTITAAMTIDGTGATVTVDGASTYRPLIVNGSGKTVALTGVKIQHGLCTSGGGGAVYLQAGTLNASVCIFDTNSCNTTSGGGAIKVGTGTAFNATSCAFLGNTEGGSYASGGAIGNESSGSVTVSECLFSGNSSNYYGGAIDNLGSSSNFTATNCTFWNNSCGYTGGGLEVEQGSYSVVNCTFSGNSASTSGSGADVHSASSGSFLNCIFWGDTTSELSGSGSISYSCIQGGVPGGTTDGGNNISTDPVLGTLASNGGPTQTMSITSSSTAYETGTATGAPTTDQRGIAANSPPSMGAYQVGAATPSAPIAPTSLTITSTDISGSTPGSLSSGSTTYSVEYSTNGGSTWTAVASTLTTGVGNLSTNAAWDTGAVFTPGTATNQVRYNAWNTSGNTEGAATANQTMVDGAPTGLTVTADTDALDLSWSAPSGVVTGYKGYYRVHNTGGYSLGYDGTSNTTTTGTITSLTAGVLYDVYVTALDVTGESAGSAVETGTPLAPVVAPTLTAALAANKAIVITGTLNGSGNLVNIYRGTSSGEESGTPIATSVSLPYTDNGRTNGTTYYYAAKSVEGDRLSVASNEVSGTPQAYGQLWP